MISVKNLTKIYRTHVRQENLLADIFFRQYKNKTAVDQISFEIKDDELVGFIGPNGAGKTTTLKMLAGILYPTSGQINVNGFIPFEKKFTFLQQIGFIMGQRNQLIWDLPASDTFKLNKEIYEVDDRQYSQTVDFLSDILHCREFISKPVKTLSLGERMKMELIAALIHRPKLVFFDEPTIGLDIFSQEVIRDFIRNYQQEEKATVILTSHYMEDVKRLAKRLIIINHGRILYDGTLKSILEKYSHEKKVKITLERSVNQTELLTLGKLESYTYPFVTYCFNRSELPEKIRQITKTLPFSDLTVEDETIEEVIKNFFSAEASQPAVV